MTSIAMGEVPNVVDVGSGYTSVYAVEGRGGVVLVDAHNPDQEQPILRRLERAGIDPDRVTLVLVTHAHPDHAGSAAALREILGVPVALGAEDAALAAAGHIDQLPPTGGRGRLISSFLNRDWPGFEADIEVVDFLDLTPYGVDGVARVVGGHTPGSMVVELDGGTVLSGDLIRGRMAHQSTPTLHFFHDDGVEAHAQLTTLLANPEVTTLLPAHGHALDAAEVRHWLETRAPRHHERLEALAQVQQ